MFSKNTPVTFARITKKYCENFKLYLEKNLSQNSTHTYFARFKNALNIAVQDDILDTNPAQFITVKKEKVSRQFLDEQEIKRLIATPCYSKQTKNAFLFSCFTGLRISDIRQLKWKDVDNNFLYIKQIKTNEPFRMKLSQAALDILKLQ
ncbi:MAG: hypothetical protein B6D61_11395 [Bacteroidetes bacterium 4484_249]|nr:MAG: hypothetical protein B6D61_11395 [Bacteroidetes bacterium 4484_249]